MDFSKYVGKSIIAQFSYDIGWTERYGRDNHRCYVHPLFVIRGNSYDPIIEEDEIQVQIQGGKTAEEVFSDLGSLPLATININTVQPGWGENSLRFNPQFGRNSEIEIQSIIIDNLSLEDIFMEKAGVKYEEE